MVLRQYPPGHMVNHTTLKNLLYYYTYYLSLPKYEVFTTTKLLPQMGETY